MKLKASICRTAIVFGFFVGSLVHTQGLSSPSSQKMEQLLLCSKELHFHKLAGTPGSIAGQYGYLRDFQSSLQDALPLMPLSNKGQTYGMFVPAIRQGKWGFYAYVGSKVYFFPFSKSQFGSIFTGSSRVSGGPMPTFRLQFPKEGKNGSFVSYVRFEGDSLRSERYAKDGLWYFQSDRTPIDFNWTDLQPAIVNDDARVGFDRESEQVLSKALGNSLMKLISIYGLDDRAYEMEIAQNSAKLDFTRYRLALRKELGLPPDLKSRMRMFHARARSCLNQIKCDGKKECLSLVNLLKKLDESANRVIKGHPLIEPPKERSFNAE